MKRQYKERPPTRDDIARELAAQVLTLEEQLEASIANEKRKRERG